MDKPKPTPAEGLHGCAGATMGCGCLLMAGGVVVCVAVAVLLAAAL